MSLAYYTHARTPNKRHYGRYPCKRRLDAEAVSDIPPCRLAGSRDLAHLAFLLDQPKDDSDTRSARRRQTKIKTDETTAGETAAYTAPPYKGGWGDPAAARSLITSREKNPHTISAARFVRTTPVVAHVGAGLYDTDVADVPFKNLCKDGHNINTISTKAVTNAPRVYFEAGKKRRAAHK